MIAKTLLLALCLPLPLALSSTFQSQQECDGCDPSTDDGENAERTQSGLGYVELSWMGASGSCVELYRRIVDEDGHVTFERECHEGTPDYCALQITRETGNIDPGSATYARKSSATGDVWGISQGFPTGGTTGTAITKDEEVDCGSSMSFRLSATVNQVAISATLDLNCSGCGD